jgi:hypothetical protein
MTGDEPPNGHSRLTGECRFLAGPYLLPVGITRPTADVRVAAACNRYPVFAGIHQ